MKNTLLAILFLYLFLPTLCYADNFGIVSVCFTPGGACTNLVTDQINNAKQQVLVQAYSFTSPEIIKALTRAKERGIDVRVILDRTNSCDDKEKCEKRGNVAASNLASAGVPVLIDQIHGIAHNKVMIIDATIIITGSFNFTRAAQERNAENLLIINNSDLAKQYISNWENRASHSK